MDRFNVCHTWFDGQGSLIGLTLFLGMMLLCSLAAGVACVVIGAKMTWDAIRDREWMLAFLTAGLIPCGLLCFTVVIMFWESTACYFAAW